MMWIVFSFSFFLILLFIFVCSRYWMLRWLSVVAESGVGVGGGSSGCCPQVSHCGAFCCAAQALECTGFSSCGSQALEHRLSSYGA